MTETTHSSFRTILASVVGMKFALLIGFGLLLLCCGGVQFTGILAALGWHDHAWTTALKTVVEAPSDHVDPTLDGSLVVVVGQAGVDAPATDPRFAVSRVDAVALVRVVETWQWIQSEEVEVYRTGNKKRYSRHTVYTKGWAQGVADSHAFAEPEGHLNPTEVAHQDAVFLGVGARVGAYALTQEVIEAVPALDVVVLEEADARRMGGHLVDNHVHLHDAPQQPQIGDQRVSFRVMPPMVLTVMAMQQNGALRAWSQDVDGEVVLARPGVHSASELVWRQRRDGLVAGGALAALGGGVGCGAAALALLGVVAVVVLRRILARPRLADDARGQAPNS